ncbi:MAG TPA: RNA polymerase sigma factor [Gemmatimonadales bacterium]|nr:RNA polymerase sigma factor [Gemmatimonadales bacterium]
MARVLRGDTEAFGLLIRRYEAGLLRFATRLLGSPDDAEGAVAESLARAYRHLSGCRGVSNLRPWPYGIVANRCKTYLARSRTAPIALEGAPALAAPADGTGTLEQREELALVQKELVRLSSELREAFLLKHDEGMTYAEMTEGTGAPIGALKMRVHRGREALLKALEHPWPESRSRE